MMGNSVRNCWWSAGKFACVVMLLIAIPVTAELGRELVRPKLRMTTTLFEEDLLETKVNEQANRQTVTVLRSGSGAIWMNEQDVRQWRIEIPPGTELIDHDGARYIPLHALPDSRYTFNPQRAELALALPAEAFRPSSLGKKEVPVVPRRPAPGAYLNYDFFGQQAQGRSQLDSRLELGLFNQFGTGNISMLARDLTERSEMIRLDTTWTLDRPADMASLRIGDSISRGGAWGRPIRFGGLQWSTNFATRPDFIAFPQLNLGGSAALPSTVDLYINNVRTYRQEVEPGPFSLNNVPVLTGGGEARLVVRDLFGREQVIVQPYYVSRNLLKKGLSDYSYEVGAERLNYGFESNDYGSAVGSATHRYGFTSRLTGEVHGEAQRERQNVGVGGVYLLGSRATVDAALAASTSRLGEGALAAIGYDSQGRYFSYGARTQHTTKEFSQQGLLPGGLAPAAQSSAFFAFHSVRLGSIGMTYIRQDNRILPDAELLSANYSKVLSGGWYFNLNAFKDLTQNRDYVVGLTLVHALGDRTNASFNYNTRPGPDQALLQVQQNLPAGSGFGYRVLAGSDDRSRFEGGLSMQNDVGTYTVEAARFGEQEAYRANARGSLALVGGSLFASRRLGDSFAVVQTGGFPDVRVYAENQLIGRTNRKGSLLVPGLRPYQRNRITVEPDDFPLEAQVDAYEMAAIPYLRSADLLNFPAYKELAATLLLYLPDGKPVPSGTQVYLNDTEAVYPVAADGLLYVRGLQQRNTLIAQWADKRCRVLLDYPDTKEPIPNLGKFTCEPIR